MNLYYDQFGRPISYTQIQPQSQMPQQYPIVQQQVMPTQQMPQQIQTGFYSVSGIDEARQYPVAPGNSITFKDETAPYIYVKTKSFSQLEEPTFEIFRLVKEEQQQQQAAPQPAPEYALKTELQQLYADFEKLKKDIKANRKKEVTDDV